MFCLFSFSASFDFICRKYLFSLQCCLCNVVHCLLLVAPLVSATFRMQCSSLLVLTIFGDFSLFSWLATYFLERERLRFQPGSEFIYRRFFCASPRTVFGDFSLFSWLATYFSRRLSLRDKTGLDQSVAGNLFVLCILLPD